MYYLFFIFFLIMLYLLPFGAIQYSFIKFPPNNVLVWHSAMESVFVAMFIYFAVYVIRFFVSLFVSIYLLRYFDNFKRIFIYNSIVLFVLFLLDNIVIKIVDFRNIYNISSTSDYLFFMLFCSITIVFFPFWLVFGIRNLIHYIKGLKNKKSE